MKSHLLFTVNMASEDIFVCGFCSFKSSMKNNLLKHLKECHSNNPGFHINCSLCSRTFKVFSSFTSHVSRSHPGVILANAYNCQARMELELEAETDHFCDINEYHPPDTESSNTAQMSAAHFLVGLKEKYMVSQISTCVLEFVEITRFLKLVLTILSKVLII